MLLFFTQVSTNDILIQDSPVSSLLRSPSCLLIASFWADFDHRNSKDVYYQVTTTMETLEQISLTVSLVSSFQFTPLSEFLNSGSTTQMSASTQGRGRESILMTCGIYVYRNSGVCVIFMCVWCSPQ